MAQDVAKQTISKIIYEARLAKGWTREVLAQKVHAHVTSVAAWENGTSLPHEKKRILISELLGIDIVDINKLHEQNCDCDSKIIYIPSNETPHKMIESISDIFGKCNESIRAIRRNNLDESKRMQLHPYFKLLYNNIIDKRISYNSIEFVFDKKRIKELLNNIIRLSDYDYFVKVFPSEPLQPDIPMLDFFICDSTYMIISGYSPSLNVHEKPKLIVENTAAAEFMLAYWNELWNHAVPLNYLGADDLSAIHKLAIDFGLTEAEFNQTVDNAKEAKIKKLPGYLL